MTGALGRNIHVKKVELRVPRATAAEQFRNDLEDALRTTSLPDQSSGSLIYVRRLRLGRLRGGISRQALSAHLAKCLAATPMTTLTWGKPAPPETADIVQIRDVVTAAAFALDSILKNQTPHWAVTRVFPHLAAASNTAFAIAETLRQLIAATSAAGPGRIAALPGGLDLLIRALEVLPEHDVASLAPPVAQHMVQDLSSKTDAALAVPMTRQPAPLTEPSKDKLRPQDITKLAASAPGAWRAAAQICVPRWRAEDRRTQSLLSWVAAATEGSSGAVRSTLRLKRIAAAEQSSVVRPPARETSPSALRDHPDNPASPTPSTTKRATPDQPTATVPHDERVDAHTPIQHDEIPEGQAHPAAGFWLLIPVLRLLACDHADEALDLPVFRAVLGQFADRLGLAEKDPIRTVMTPDLDCAMPDVPTATWGPHPTVLSLLAGQRGLFADQAGDSLAMALRPSTPFFAQIPADSLPKSVVKKPTLQGPRRDPVTGMALAVERLTAQLLGGRGWRWLVARRGLITITATHIDVTFDGRDVDAEVRIAGLDLNPGWVPALGRIITFHYDYDSVRDPGGPPDE